MPVKVLVLYNEPVLPPTHPDAASERDILDTVDVVAQTLAEAGFAVARLGVRHDPHTLLTGLTNERPDVVFNLFEGLADRTQTEASVMGLLEWLGVPFTGSPMQAACLARDKPLTKYLLQGAGLPTAPFAIVEQLPVPDLCFDWPLMVKPAAQEASVGIDQGSVVHDPRSLHERVAHLLRTYGPPVLVEQFIAGREFNIGLLETPTLRVLPPAEILFLIRDPGYHPIVSYDAKWKPSSAECELTPSKCPADVDPELAERLADLGRRAFRLVGCRDYARVDFRVDAAGRPFILEVNANPDISPSAGLARALAAAGISHARFLVDLVEAALRRRTLTTSDA